MQKALLFSLLLAAPWASSQWVPISPIGCGEGDRVSYRSATKDFGCTPASVPTGSILIIDGTTLSACPSGFTEIASLNGKALRGTVAANGDVGTAIGSDTATPTVNSLTAAAQVFTGSALGTHTHSVTSNVAQNVFTNPTITWPAGVPTLAMNSYTPAGTIASSSQTKFTTNASGSNANTTAARTFVGTPATLTGTNSWPAGVPTASGGSVSLTNNAVTSEATSGGTPAGTNGTSAVTGTLNSISTIPASIRVIFCRAN
jgi:hypothetical protein